MYSLEQPSEIDGFIPILPLRTLKHGEVNNLHKATQLVHSGFVIPTQICDWARLPRECRLARFVLSGRVCVGYLHFISRRYPRCVLYHWVPEKKFLIPSPHMFFFFSQGLLGISIYSLLRSCKVISLRSYLLSGYYLIKTTLFLGFLLS